MSFLPTQEMPLSFATVWICLRLHFKQSRNPRPQTDSERAAPSPLTGLLQQEEKGEKGTCYQMGLLCRDVKLCNFTLLLPNNHNVHLLRNNYWRIQIPTASLTK